jgi:hypothetical protein
MYVGRKIQVYREQHDDFCRSIGAVESLASNLRSKKEMEEDLQT